MKAFKEVNIRLEYIYRVSLVLNVKDLYDGKRDNIAPIRQEEFLKNKEIEKLLDKAQQENDLAYTFFFMFKLNEWTTINSIALGIWEYQDSIKDEIKAFFNELETIEDNTPIDRVKLYINRYIELQKEIIAYNYYATYFYDVLLDVMPPVKIDYNTYSRLNIKIRQMAKEQGLTVPNKSSYKVNTNYPEPDTKEAVQLLQELIPVTTIKAIKRGITIEKGSH